MDGLKARLSFDAVAYDYDDEYLTIDTDTHTININNVSRLFGVQYDGNSKLIKFRIRNKLSEIQKMQDSIVYINWIDSKGVKGQSIAINKTISNDICEFAWKVPFDALKNSGVLHFAMSAVITEDNSSVINQKWSTQIASVTTPDGIYIKSYTPSSEEEDRIAQIYNELSNMINTQSENLQSQVNSLKEECDYLERSAISELQENLLNGVTIYKGKNIDGSGREPLVGDPNFCYTDYIVVTPREMYYFVGRGYIFYEFYDINKKYIRGTYKDMGADIDTLSAISPDEARFLRLSFGFNYEYRPRVINYKIRNLVETVEKLNTEKMQDFYSFNFRKEDLLDTFAINPNTGRNEYDISYYCTPFMRIPSNAVKLSVTGYNIGDNGLYKQIVFYDNDYNYISGTFNKDEVSVPKNAIYVSCSFGKMYFENVKIVAKKENVENFYNKKEIDSKIDSITLKVTNSETEISLIDSKISSAEDKLDVERKRIDNFTSLPNGSTSGDAELQDMRVGADGVIYSNAGEALRKQIEATQNLISEPIKTMYRYLMVSFGYDEQHLSLLGSDDLETFYLINKNAYNMTKGRTNALRDPAITQIGKYYYIVYSDGYTDSTKLYMCRTINFVDYEELEPIDITNADGSEPVVIWAPCWFKHDGKLYVILNSDSGLQGTRYGEYDYITHTVSPTSKFNFKDYPQTIDVHIYYENNYFYAIIKDESKRYDSLHILKSDSLSGEFVSVGNNLQTFGYAEGQFAIRLDNGKIRIFAVELGVENIPIKYADLDTFESEPSEIKAIRYVGIGESYKLSHATYWDFNKFGSGYGLLG
jgi:hypothetical protein